jgi:ketosteroid isomerase-like protein
MRLVAMCAAVASQALAAAPAASPVKPAAPAAARPAPSDKAQIAALERGFMAAFNAKNVGRIMSYYDKNGLFVFDVVVPRDYPSWASYEKDFQDLFAANPGPLDMKLSDLAITVVGDVAYGHSIQGGYFTDKAGKKTEMVVRVSDVYRKVGGRWKIVQEHVSVPIDLATGQPDMLSKP